MFISSLNQAKRCHGKRSFEKRADCDGDRPLSKISPLTYASSKQPPCIIFFGTADVLQEGAELYRKDSQKSGNSCKLITYEGQGHGFFNHGARGGKHYDLTLAEMDRFLVDLGWLKYT